MEYHVINNGHYLSYEYIGNKKSRNHPLLLMFPTTIIQRTICYTIQDIVYFQFDVCYGKHIWFKLEYGRNSNFIEDYPNGLQLNVSLHYNTSIVTHWSPVVQCENFLIIILVFNKKNKVNQVGMHWNFLTSLIILFSLS